MSDTSHLAMIAEPIEGLEIKVPYGLSPSETDLYRLLTGNGYRVLRHGWPDFFVVPGDGSPGFAVEVKSGSSRVRPGQVEMHAALEAAGIKVLVVKEPRKLGLPAKDGRGPGRMFTETTGREAGLRGGTVRSQRLPPLEVTEKTAAAAAAEVAELERMLEPQDQAGGA